MEDSNSSSNLVMRLSDDLAKRMQAIHQRADVSVLNQANSIDLIEAAIPYILLGEQKEQSAADIFARVGHRTMEKLGINRDSPKAAKIGAFIAESFVRTGAWKLETQIRKGDRHSTYYIYSDDDDAVSELWELISDDSTEQLPFTEQQDDWGSGYHSSGIPLIRHAPKSLLNTLHPLAQPLVFQSLNKLQSQGWRVDDQMLRWYISAFNNIGKATYIDKDGKSHYSFSHMNPEEKKDARTSMKREAQNIRDIAKRVKGKPFYHMYNCDFRGRIYPATAYLHEQSSDRAKGLLRLDEPKPLGEFGYKWLCIHAANSWGEDKLSLKDRQQFALDHKDKWIEYAKDPFNDKEWIMADKPWSFLHCCLVFKQIDEWVKAGNSIESFLCSMPVFIDGSQNGCQHLTALARDEGFAPLVNLLPSDLPGDLYVYIATNVWNLIDKDYDPNKDSDLTILLTELEDLKLPFAQWQDKETFEKSRLALKEFREKNKDRIKSLGPNYWMQFKKDKERRKIIKRNVMTVPYGGTRAGFAEQIREDTKHMGWELKSMEFIWSVYLGGLVYDVCRGSDNVTSSMPGPASMLKLFETLAIVAVNDDRKLNWTVPVTNFPVVQQYKKPTTKRVAIDFMGSRIRLSIAVIENQKIDKSKQISAAAPNVIHSFDAAHLQMTVVGSLFPTVTVHDSFGCLPSDMEDLFRIVRMKFVEFYDSDPLNQLLTETNCIHLMPPKGNLDLNGIIESEYSFA